MLRPLLAVLPWLGLAWFAWFLGGWVQGGDAAIEYAVNFPPNYSVSDIRTPTYNYSPAFAFWIQPLQLIPFEAFLTLIIAAELAVLAWLVTPWIALLLVVVQAPVIYPELLNGQFNLLVAGAVVAGFRYPMLYAPLLLTKVTPGVGLVWFAVRREWRSLAMALGATLWLALPAMILAPLSWTEWIGNLLANNDRIEGNLPLMVRGPIAVALIAWGAWTDRRWTVPLAVALSFPLNYLGWVVALGAVRLVRKDYPINVKKLESVSL